MTHAKQRLLHLLRRRSVDPAHSQAPSPQPSSAARQPFDYRKKLDDSMPPGAISIPEACEIAGISETLIRWHLKTRHIPSIRSESGRVLYPSKRGLLDAIRRRDPLDRMIWGPKG